MSKDYGLKITIPDLPVNEQLKMINDMRFVVETFSRVAGETTNLKPFDDAIAKLAPPKAKEERIKVIARQYGKQGSTARLMKELEK